MKTLMAMSASIVLTSCATLMHGSSQDVGVQSSPTGANVTIDNQTTGQTPYVAHLSRRDNHIVKVALPGYAPAEMTLTRGVSGWVWGNIIFGGIPGLAVDAISGGLYDLTPSQLSATLLAQSVTSESQKSNPSPIFRTAPAQPPSPVVDAVTATPAGVHAQASIGPPQSEEERRAAMQAFEEGNAYVGSHEWSKAEQSFQRALLADGSVAKYHAAMGALMMLLHRWADAEASYSAAVLIDVDNPDYRRLLKEARTRH